MGKEVEVDFIFNIYFEYSLERQAGRQSDRKTEGKKQRFLTKCPQLSLMCKTKARTRKKSRTFMWVAESSTTETIKRV